ncbi:DUF5658 family protein [Rhodopirellula sallentina]|uniref:Membrane protein n=1 Tax=Rhodopirellula sallentina SM41 TaxID=1263870 RepID=M5UK45_9BACT|nr:DUF5658 family protein [Rhodopirellula sallentina]EMI56393.1 membrane protein [Rhodopirellula sallentina SM41]
MKTYSFCRRFGLRAAAAILLLASMSVVVQAQPRGFDREFGDSGRLIETEEGFLFVDGVYVPSPYKIEFEEDLFRINGQEYSASSYDLTRYVNRGGGMRGRRPRGMGFRGGERFRGERSQDVTEYNPLSGLAREMAYLNHGAIVILKSDMPPMLVWPGQHGYELLQTLVATADGPIEDVEVPRAVTTVEDQQLWTDLVVGFDATEPFLARAGTLINEMNSIETTAERQHAAQRLSEQIGYPLTVFALVLVVVAVGHLLTYAQATNLQIDDPKMRETIKKSTVISLVIVGLMSAVDLVWTLVAHQTGTMREMNPLGSRLISDPLQLITFKVLITSLSIGLLFWLRELPFARRATWWCCLVLTLLTARWVTFHSLFV